MQVKDIMSARPVSIGPEETIAVAARSLSRLNIGSLPVCSRDGKLRGILTDRDIVLRSVAVGEDAGQQLVRDVMTRRLVTVSPEETLAVAANLMAREQIRRLPVVQGGRLCGMLTLKDLAAAPGQAMEAARALWKISGEVRTL